MAEKTVNMAARNESMKKNLQTFVTLQKTMQDIDHEFPLQYSICLAEIALNPGIGLTELAERTAMPLSTVSRIVGALSKNRQKGKPYGLVRTVKPEEERRRKLLYLSESGERLIGKISTTLEPDMIGQKHCA